MTATPIAARFTEDPPESAMEKQRAIEGWMVIKDRATGRAFIVGMNDRINALWLLKLMNAADEQLPIGEVA